MLFPSHTDKWEGIVFSRTERRALESLAQGDGNGWLTTSLLPGVTVYKAAN